MIGNGGDNDFIGQLGDRNEIESIVNGIKPEIEDADNEPIYAISDFEGRFDYYIRFFTDIGLLDEGKLKIAVEELADANINGENTLEEKEKIMHMLTLLLENKLENQQEELFEQVYDKGFNTINSGEAGRDENIERLKFLKKYFTEDVLKSAINKNFKGKIVINGDLYSSRVNRLFGKNENEIVAINELCFDLFNTIKKDDDVKNKLILVAGNHDVYHMDRIDNQLVDRTETDILADIKNKTLQYLNKWFKVKTKDGKMLIFKHSPRLMEDEVYGKDLSEIIDDKNDRAKTGLTKIIDYNTASEEDRDVIYKYYFYNGFGINKTTGQERRTFNANDGINNTVKTMLTKNHAKLVVGHCHAGGKIKDGCICIDDDGKYKYRVFHFEKKKDISNDTNNVDDECNLLNSTREDVYYDDISYDSKQDVNKDNLFDNEYIFQQKNNNNTKEDVKRIIEEQKKNGQLLQGIDCQCFNYLIEDEKLENNKSNVDDGNKNVEDCLGKQNNLNAQDNNNNNPPVNQNPIFKIMQLGIVGNNDVNNGNQIEVKNSTDINIPNINDNISDNKENSKTIKEEEEEKQCQNNNNTDNITQTEQENQNSNSNLTFRDIEVDETEENNTKNINIQEEKQKGTEDVNNGKKGFLNSQISIQLQLGDNDKEIKNSRHKPYIDNYTFTLGPQSSENLSERNNYSNQQSGNGDSRWSLKNLCPCLCWK